MRDIGLREVLMLAALALLIIMLGLYPQPALDSARPALDRLVAGDIIFEPADSDLVPASPIASTPLSDDAPARAPAPTPTEHPPRGGPGGSP